ncbi:MAG: GNAT family N-acetyltransferase [Phycisphaerales bacterium]
MIREASTHDATVIAGLSVQLGYPASVPETSDRIEACIRREGEALIVYERAGVVVAWLEVQRRHAMESGEWAEIVGMVVDERRRGEGIGTAMVEWAKDWTRQQGLTRLRVRTNQRRTDAAAFYERRGFVLTKTHKVYDITL